MSRSAKTSTEHLNEPPSVSERSHGTTSATAISASQVKDDCGLGERRVKGHNRHYNLVGSKDKYPVTHEVSAFSSRVARMGEVVVGTRSNLYTGGLLSCIGFGAVAGDVHILAHLAAENVYDQSLADILADLNERYGSLSIRIWFSKEEDPKEEAGEKLDRQFLVELIECKGHTVESSVEVGEETLVTISPTGEIAP